MAEPTMMVSFRFFVCRVLMLCLHFSWSTAATVIQFDSGVQKFLTSYCIKCHDAKVQKGDRSFHKLATIDGDRFSIDLADTEKVHLLRDILDQLNLGEMPPQKRRSNFLNPRNQEHNCLADANSSHTRRGERHFPYCSTSPQSLRIPQHSP